MLKNIKKIFRVVLGCIAIIVAPHVYSKTIHIPVELRCSKNPTTASWKVLNGISGVQYTITTKGLRESGNDIMKIVNVDGLGTVNDDLHVYVEARCLPQNDEVDISPTDSSLACNQGEGIAVKMFAPNNIDPNKYHYVGILAVTENEEKVQEFTINDSIVSDIDKESPHTNAKLVKPNVEVWHSSVVCI